MIESEIESRIEVVEDGETLVVGLLDSYVNYASADFLKPLLKEILSGAMEEGRTRFVMDLRNVGVMDSCGLSVLISLKKLVDGRGGQLALTNLSAMVQRLFALTRLDRAFDVVPVPASTMPEQ